MEGIKSINSSMVVNYNNFQRQTAWDSKAVNGEVNKTHIPKDTIRNLVEKTNKVIQDTTHLKFEIHDKTNTIMIKIINDNTGEVIKEIPPEKLLDIAASMMELAGVLLDEKR